MSWASRLMSALIATYLIVGPVPGTATWNFPLPNSRTTYTQVGNNQDHDSSWPSRTTASPESSPSYRSGSVLPPPPAHSLLHSSTGTTKTHWSSSVTGTTIAHVHDSSQVQPAPQAAVMTTQVGNGGDPELDSWCPRTVRRAVSPYCQCEGSRQFPVLSCAHFESAEYMRRVLNVQFPIEKFGRLVVVNSTVDQILENTLPADKQFSMITFRKTAIKTVDIASLGPSKPVVKRLELVHNKLEKFPFSDLSQFRNLVNLDLYYNEFTSIPDYAFGSNRVLRSIDLSFNKISHVGSYAFAELPNLEKLDLRFNNIKVVNNHAFASALFDNRQLTLDLSHNKLFYLADGAFEGMIAKHLKLDSNSLTKFPQKHFLPMLRAMVAQQVGKITISGNRIQCSCAETSWLVALTDTYKDRVEGFECNNLTPKKVLSQLNYADLKCY